MKFKSNANAQAMSKGIKWFAFAIVTLVAIYGDVMFLQLMLPAFPDNWIMRGLACIGAIATALSVILLYIGKSRWFRPGSQLIWAYWFTAIEFTILALNCIVAFAFHQSSSLDWVLQIWFYLCPVTPLVSAGGWVLINHFDRDNQEMHEDMELEDDQRAAMREYKRQEHQAHMDILHRTLELKTAYLRQFVDSQEGQSGVKEAAEGFGRQVLSGLAGYPVIPAIKPPTVDGTGHSVDDNKGFPTRQDVKEKGSPSIFGEHPDGYKAALDQWQAQQPPAVPQPAQLNQNDDISYHSINGPADYWAMIAQMRAEMDQLKQQSSPLANPVLNPSSQNGTENGHSH